MKIYTKAGDSGTTSLIGGTKVPKYDIRIETYGTVDELISYIGLIRDQDIEQDTINTLIQIQDRLMTCAAIIASDNTKRKKKLPVIQEDDIKFLEENIDEISNTIQPLKSFILPGGHPVVSLCHIARTICRRAERNYTKVEKIQKIDKQVLKYLNRLSDYIYMLARKLANDLKAVEIPWKPKVGND